MLSADSPPGLTTRGFNSATTPRCAAMNCADGKGSPPVSLAERQAYRKQALDLLAAELASPAKLAASDREFVDAVLREWLADNDLASVRPPKTADLPPEQRKGWEEFWAKVKSLIKATELAERFQSP